MSPPPEPLEFDIADGGPPKPPPMNLNAMDHGPTGVSDGMDFAAADDLGMTGASDRMDLGSTGYSDNPLDYNPATPINIKTEPASPAKPTEPAPPITTEYASPTKPTEPAPPIKTEPAEPNDGAASDGTDHPDWESDSEASHLG